MLQSIRDKSHGLASKIFIGFIVLVFALFGIDSLVGTFINGTSGVSVNGVDIDELTIESETQRKTQELVQSLGVDIDISSIDPTLMRQSALDGLIQQELLLQAASNSGMVISSKAIDMQIARTADFQIDGVFNNERAQVLLQSYGYTPASYRVTLTRDRILNQLAIAYSASGFVTALEIEQAAALTLQKRNLRYLLLSPEGLADSISISDSEVEEYYLDNANEFMREEQLSLEYLALDKNDIFAEVEITEEQVRAQYALQIAEYESQIERRASHILLEAFDDDEFLEAEVLAQELKERIDAGEDFEELAAEFSTDQGSAAYGGDVGFTTGDNFVTEFEEALQALGMDEVSEPVRTEFGYHLIMLTDQSTTEIETYEMLEEGIRRDLQTDEVNNLYLARAEELNNLSFESLDLRDPAEILNMDIQTTELFGRTGGVGIAANSVVISAAFGSEVLEDGLNSELISINDSLSVVVRLVDHNAPELIELVEVQGEINVFLRDEGVREQVRSSGESIVTNLNNGQNIDSLLQIQGLSWNSVNGLQRSNTSVDQEMIENIFSMAKPTDDSEPVLDSFQLVNGDYIVVELQEVIPGTLEDFNVGEEENIANYITQQTAANDFDDFLAGMQARATIK